MRIIRFKNDNDSSTLGAINEEGTVYTLPYKDFLELLEDANRTGKSCLDIVNALTTDGQIKDSDIDDLQLLPPISAYEVWACGVTYLKSREARNYEAFDTKEKVNSYYDLVYEAKRPELFLKATSRRIVAPGDPINLRTDSNWQVPEPELGLVLQSNGEIVGYTIGNDLSSRDIEGENPLYLPQAKIWKNACAIGPAILLADAVKDPYNFSITCRIYRNNNLVFAGEANTKELKRTYEELITYLLQDNVIFDGTILLTGTSIVPDDDFTLLDGDVVEIEISGIGVLRNPVQQEKNLLS